MKQNEKSQKFTIYYDAKKSELSKHKIDAYALGSSILEMSKMIYEADRVINSTEKTIDLLVTAPVKKGSVAIEFVANFLNNGGMDVLKYIGLTAASSSIVGGSAIAVSQIIRDKKVLSIDSYSDSDEVEIKLNNETIKCDKTVAELVTNPKIRKAMSEVIAQPLINKEEPVFRIEVNNVETLRLTNENIVNIRPLNKDSFNSQESVKTLTTNVKLTQINFKSKNGWKMVYENEEKNVTIQDESFFERISHNALAFKEGDIFKVELTIEEKNTANSKRTKYIIKKVLRHRASKERKLV
ncbi:hypothetical protein [Gilliamella apicola]|uniref:hypothetical protein n=1 Tax=Gilliamella apicola TaxID=1196095 RepID=UPI002FEE61F4